MSKFHIRKKNLPNHQTNNQQADDQPSASTATVGTTSQPVMGKLKGNKRVLILLLVIALVVGSLVWFAKSRAVPLGQACTYKSRRHILTEAAPALDGSNDKLLEQKVQQIMK